MSNPEIFISYAWGGESEEIVNELDHAIQQKGIVIIRDKRDLGFKGVITDFMKRIGQGKAVIIVISDKYLKSTYCMFELIEIFRYSRDNNEFIERIFPIVLSDAKIFNPLDRVEYFKYWKSEKEKLEKLITELGADAIMVIGDDYKVYQKIINEYGEVAKILSDINSLSTQIHRDDNYETLIEAISKKNNYKQEQTIPINQIRELIAQNKIEKAIEELKLMVKENEHFNDLISASASLVASNKDFKRGIISRSDFELIKNKTVFRLLDILDELK